MTQAFPSERWAQYDERVEDMLDIGAAWVVETLLRTTARMPPRSGSGVMLETQVCC